MQQAADEFLKRVPIQLRQQIKAPTRLPDARCRNQEIEHLQYNPEIKAKCNPVLMDFMTIKPTIQSIPFLADRVLHQRKTDEQQNPKTEKERVALDVADLQAAEQGTSAGGES